MRKRAGSRAAGPRAAGRLSWETITETDWAEQLARSRFSRDHRVRRVFADCPEYEQVVRLRYAGFVESGFLDPKTCSLESMRLPRDPHSIILGLFRRGSLKATVTLNTIGPRFPGMAMELEKGVIVPHEQFRSPDVMEITKLVVDRRARGMRSVLALLSVSVMIAKLLGKTHLWQVSRNPASDISWRTGLGFDYSINFSFVDRSLNDMPSRVGYLHLPSVLNNRSVPRFIRAIYRDALDAEGSAGHVAVGVPA